MNTLLLLTVSFLAQQQGRTTAPAINRTTQSFEIIAKQLKDFPNPIIVECPTVDTRSLKTYGFDLTDMNELSVFATVVGSRLYISQQSFLIKSRRTITGEPAPGSKEELLDVLENHLPDSSLVGSAPASELDNTAQVALGSYVSDMSGLAKSVLQDKSASIVQGAGFVAKYVDPKTGRTYTKAHYPNRLKHPQLTPAVKKPPKVELPLLIPSGNETVHFEKGEVLSLQEIAQRSSEAFKSKFVLDPLLLNNKFLVQGDFDKDSMTSLLREISKTQPLTVADRSDQNLTEIRDRLKSKFEKALAELANETGIPGALITELWTSPREYSRSELKQRYPDFDLAKLGIPPDISTLKLEVAPMIVVASPGSSPMVDQFGNIIPNSSMSNFDPIFLSR